MLGYNTSTRALGLSNGGGSVTLPAPGIGAEAQRLSGSTTTNATTGAQTTLNLSGGTSSTASIAGDNLGTPTATRNLTLGNNLLVGGISTTGLGITSGGNVGIGEASPTSKREVAGALKLQSGAAVNEFSTDGALAGNSDAAVPTEKAIKTYANTKLGSVSLATGSPFSGSGTSAAPLGIRPATSAQSGVLSQTKHI